MFPTGNKPLGYSHKVGKFLLIHPHFTALHYNFRTDHSAKNKILKIFGGGLRENGINKRIKL